MNDSKTRADRSDDEDLTELLKEMRELLESDNEEVDEKIRNFEERYGVRFDADQKAAIKKGVIEDALSLMSTIANSCDDEIERQRQIKFYSESVYFGPVNILHGGGEFGFAKDEDDIYFFEKEDGRWRFRTTVYYDQGISFMPFSLDQNEVEKLQNIADELGFEIGLNDAGHLTFKLP